VAPPPELVQRAGSDAPVVQLLWLEPGSTDRLWDDPALGPLLGPLAEASKDEPAHAYARSIGLGPEAFREALTVLAQAEPVGEQGMTAALRGALAGGGPVVPPLVVAAGQLELRLEPREALEVAAEVVAALFPTDEAAQAAAEQARAVPEARLAGAVPAVAQAHETLRQACAQGAEPVAARELDVEVARTLLAAKRVQRRELFGAEHHRALLHVEGATHPLVAYLPESAAGHLPLIHRLAVRVLVEVHPPQDPNDPGPVALRIRALGRLDPKPSWRAQGRWMDGVAQNPMSGDPIRATVDRPR